MITRRKIYRKNNVIDNYFQLWSSNMAYILGFITADGCIYNNSRGQDYISLAITDFDIIKYIRDEISPGRTISIRKKKKDSHKTQYILRISSNQLCSDLAKYYVTPRKTGNEKLPEIPEKYFGDYLRGLFDGDGSIVFRRREEKRCYTAKVSICSASHSFLLDINSKLNNIGNIYIDSSWYVLSIQSKNSISNIYDIMYSNKDSFRLTRKYNKFMEMVNAGFIY